MKFIKSLTTYLILCCIALFSASSYAVKVIDIDASDTGKQIPSSMFGANFVFTWNNFDQLENTLPHLRQHLIRYPGGSITENQFDPTNPNVYLDGSRVSQNRSISRYIELVNQHNWRAVFVLPSIRYKNNINRGRNEIRSFVNALLQGNYGTIESGRTVHFEIGNEQYANDITPSEYGDVANALVTAIHQGVDDSTRGGNYTIEVSVQSGQTVSQARTIASKLRSHRNRINHLTFHWYPGVTEIQLGFRRFDGTTEKFSRRLQNITNTWQQRAGYSKPFFLSEFNIRNRNNNTFDLGLRNPMGLMSIFAEGVRGNTKLATVWPLMSRDNLRTRLFTSLNGRDVTPTTNGIFYRWLEGDLKNSRLIEGINNQSYSNESNFRQGVYTEAFRKGNDTLIVYAFGTAFNQDQVRLSFSNFTINSVSAQRLYTAAGEESNPNVVAQTANLKPRIWGNDRRATFTINRFSQYEVVRLVFKGNFQ
ncbi:hypothetical protein [Sessilibacter corallicola]|uniref:hypothetical protein n=1 Tax=Sessilibacter corallicola TaxID=2904075 RepID=UPI001E4A01CE|nr:hypothetical protein [Sessilibacter corallicola]MCE2029383.1 hypothetical protein [Sessilibacter corallicola]